VRKIALAALLVALADHLFFFHGPAPPSACSRPPC
jgi:hypothetical protein